MKRLTFPNGQQTRIGVFGGAFTWTTVGEKTARDLGVHIVEQGCIVVTGATTGLPYHAGKGALAAGGMVLGVSPAHDPEEHVQKYEKPLDGATLILWTGAGYTGRNYLNVRNCDAVIIIGGETGTLEEFCVAHYEGKVIGVLEGSGGVADKIRGIMEVSPTDHGAVIEYDADPKQLLDKVVLRLNERGARTSIQ